MTSEYLQIPIRDEATARADRQALADRDAERLERWRAENGAHNSNALYRLLFGDRQ